MESSIITEAQHAPTEVRYEPSDHKWWPARVVVEFGDDASLRLSIQDARMVAEALPAALLEHEVAVAEQASGREVGA